MPELPEVEAITGAVRKHAQGKFLTGVEIVRWNGKYFTTQSEPDILFWPFSNPQPALVRDAFRIGKYVVICIPTPNARSPEAYIIVHNAMSGYFDWDHDPWTFDYVEGARQSNETDVRVRFKFSDGKVLRFHDARLFGSMRLSHQLPIMGPELLQTKHAFPGLPIIGLEQFASALSRYRRPVKQLLMDQRILAGIGNIYSNEACHLAGIDPRTPANKVYHGLIPVLLEALRCVVLHSIPTVQYQWVKVYRRDRCGSCHSAVMKVTLGGRSTFFCEKCQS